MKTDISNKQIKRINLKIGGAVQGVGFRPAVYRLATKLGLSGWITNAADGVEIELEGHNDYIEEFVELLKVENPIHSRLDNIKQEFLYPIGGTGFKIIESKLSGDKTALVLPDIATCPDCLREIFDPDNRRYLYPFTNCTNCGPRYSIIEGLPYDRAMTTMKYFEMCGKCREEYENPLDRRFHAQPNACPECGPHLELWDKSGKVMALHNDALDQACEVVLGGEILALKGLGGFHLIVNAQNYQAVKRLRSLKERKKKPLALMYPDLASIELECEVGELEHELLTSAESPIVLMKRKRFNLETTPRTLKGIAPDNPYLGIMLPYTPLHHILMHKLQIPIVATSGNLAEEPICIDEKEALGRLSGIADLFLVHNRPIARHADDSIVRVVAERELVLRRARGYAPLPMQRKGSFRPVLATGGHLKNTIAISSGKNVFISQHIGDLDTRLSIETFNITIESLSDIYEFKPEIIACDKHPDYHSTIYAEKSGLHLVKVQHHYAHILSCMAENNLGGEVLGVVWDGTGYGDDDTIWGGEFLSVDGKSYQRFAHLRTFPLPGGERAVLRPRRSALGSMHELYGRDIIGIENNNPLDRFRQEQKQPLLGALKKEVNCPRTSSMGRLFDAVASIIGLCQEIDFEGQAAMLLEFAAEKAADDQKSYPFDFVKYENKYILDWEKIIEGIRKDHDRAVSQNRIAARFHNTLAEMIVEVAKICEREDVVLSGGCFQNKYLTEKTVGRLKEEGFKPYWHKLVPPNDGGISLGQVMAISRDRSME
ncbi:MAG: carbamoyltransferase HypF [candidate division Zixibacteria bacterium]|nr:carbamoyltransferase HypF [candidate division Zixibacteria bacterium]NIR64078.1 carbamoyltransferase HypF [candidate division Zixibacteria bacterium]NIS15407.1 carbamoyltransferase HypF [candidate division Zixibacteria bacterium]NIS45976.1 carbamoyltransferase HypF [candidate division Zixibacteria bacterium]NIT51935.1 carbamoyltransferase HypF [candidate division Zixibacteria bacterium]